MHRIKRLSYCLVFISFAAISTSVSAAKSVFIGIDHVINADKIKVVNPYAINVLSSVKPLVLSKNKLQKLRADLVYISKVKINSKVYYRLVAGNFANKKIALKNLSQLRKDFGGAWLGKRTKAERQVLSERLVKPVQKSVRIKPVFKKKFKKKLITHKPTFAQKLLVKMKQLLLDENYARLVASANKVIEIGNSKQQQNAMELLGIARERQGKFAQAISVYSAFLRQFPSSELKPKIAQRLNNLNTMALAPKKKQISKKTRKKNDDWNIYGSASQYYRDDTFKEEGLDSAQTNSLLSSGVNIFARKRTQAAVSVIRFDGSMVNDFIDNANRGRISRAMYSYSNKKKQYKVIAGRQSRTAKGALGRFDGVVYSDLSPNKFSYSIYGGFPVQSSYDALDTKRRFIGGSINFEPYPKLETDVYIVTQTNSSLTDRQAIGSQMQYVADKGFFYGLLDYDFFYNSLNNITLIGNYRYSQKLALNITMDYRNAPLLTTLNALQGQAVASLDELKNTFSDTQIYDLAKDRTSRSSNIYFNSNYLIDKRHQINFSLSLSNTAATVTSGTVLATSSSHSVYAAATYSIQNFFNINDFTSFGFRLSQSDTSETMSLQSRTRFKSKKGVRYSPRLNLDYRANKNSNLTQWILKPSIKVSYKYSKKVSFDASAGLEYSNFNLPDQNKQTIFSLYLGYLYQF